MSSALPEDILPFLRESIGETWEVSPLRGDASTRGYYRISTPAGKRYMLAYYPEVARGDVERFLRAYRAIGTSTPVPEVHFHGSAAVLQEDVGDETLFEIVKRDAERGVRLYYRAIDLLTAFQNSPQGAQILNPPFDARKFTDELEMTRRYFIEELMGRRDETIHGRLREAFARLAQLLTEHPYVLCHRDFHGQNIHVLGDALYMIDYQDLRMGPDSYDVASLLRDRGMARVLGLETEKALIEYYRARIGASPDLRKRYLESLLQRSIKVLGTFAAQAVTRKRMHYLDYIPPALESVRFCLDQLSEFSELRDIFPTTFEVTAT
jgi:aminoglycoside/choline kinase family phosphotransferase